MERLTPQEIKDRNRSQLEDKVAVARELSDELGRIVQSRGWKYAKNVSMQYVIKPYEIDPPKRGEDETAWQTYNTIRWAFERFWSIVEYLAVKPPEPTKEIDADNAGKSRSRRRTASAASGTAASAGTGSDRLRRNRKRSS